jgi:hypothetical protein
MKEGLHRGKQESLLRQLHKRFPKLPSRIEKEVRETKDEAKLNLWLDEILSADNLSDMSFNQSS